MRVIGMMSGTSFDAVDAAAADLKIVGSTIVLQPLGMVSQPYPQALKEALVAALPPARVSMERVCRLHTEVGQAFADLAARANRELCDGRADLVVSHGQTVFHWVEKSQVRGTLQIGEPAWIAEQTGLSVVSDLRSRDVAAGGQGAPLVSALDVLWLKGRDVVSAALNLGGIANVTIVDPVRDPVAFDTGPANALIDAAVRVATGGALSFDTDGRLAAAGHIETALLDALLAEPYYHGQPPKSTGKELFNWQYLERAMSELPPIGTADLVATLTTLTADTVSEALRAAQVKEVVASGGGTQNPTLMKMLRDRLPGITIRAADEYGLPTAAKEAYAFAFLGFCTVSGIPSTVPSCTGARHASILGAVTPGAAGLPLVQRPDVTPTALDVRLRPPPDSVAQTA